MFLLTAAFIFLLSLIFAFLEIEMEGANGWAEKLPTWYRSSGIASIFSRLNGGKPLTGYHLFMNLFITAAFHIGFFVGLPWSIAAELQIMCLFILFFLVEDFLWFLFNPNYGIRNFRKERIWWHNKSPWVFGLFPIDYGYSFLLTIFLASVSAYLLGDSTVLIQWLISLGATVLLIALSGIFAQSYRRWYKRMRAKDDRPRTRIFH